MIQLGMPPMQIYKDDVFRRGWSHGRAQTGQVSFLITPLATGTTLPSLRLPAKRGRVTKVEITILASSLMTRKLVEQCTARALAERFPNIKCKVVLSEESGDASRLYLLFVAHTESGFRLGYDCLYESKIGKTLAAIERAVQALVGSAGKGLEKELGCDVDDAEGTAMCLDSHMEDQVTVFMALAKERSRCQRVVKGDNHDDLGPSLHTKTAQWVVEKVCGVAFYANGECEGLGLVSGR